MAKDSYPKRSLWRRLFHSREDQLAAWDEEVRRKELLWQAHLVGCKRCREFPIGCADGWTLKLEAEAGRYAHTLKLVAGGPVGWPDRG